MAIFLVLFYDSHYFHSYGPSPNSEPYVKNFEPEESPSGMLARSGTYNVKSRVIDDDGEVYAGERMFFSFASTRISNGSLLFKILNGHSN